MSRIRTIKPEFWTDETIVECSLSTRLLFIGMWNFADDSGNIERSAKQLKMKILPADNIDIEPLIEELIKHKLVIEYEVPPKKYLHIKGFKNHQVINKPSKSKLPCFGDSLRTPVALTEDYRSIPVALTEDYFTEGKGKEGKGKEKEKPTTTPTTYVLPRAQEVNEQEKALSSSLSMTDIHFLFHESFGMQMPRGANNKAVEICQRFTKDQIHDAFEIAAVQNKPSIAYVWGILNGTPKVKKDIEDFDMNKDYPEDSFFYALKKSKLEENKNGK